MNTILRRSVLALAASASLGGAFAVGATPATAASNPHPDKVAEASSWLQEELLKLQPGTADGGIYTDKPGYHNTRAANGPTDYSVLDDNDQGGPSDKAAAYDWTFSEATNIAEYSSRLLASGQDPDDPRLDGWREFFGQADSDNEVEGWDFRTDEAATSDPSHLWHIHLSEDRDKVTSFENKEALLSVLRGETVDQWRLNK
ncbi:hypothetical protein [Salinispora fenicalii]|uniref:hypothetical protein n=1 Tax=Salinispora fenicalii TaxID=1137263 RepID=UPI0003778F9D|nr:hypothetical protein [Salinispora fenicalii]